MRRYLLFDASCTLCNKLARAIEAEAGGKLRVRSLYDPEMKALLNQARPGWQWEPTLIEVRDQRVQVYTGLAMRLRMAIVLGWRRTYQVAQILREAGVGITGIGIKRRWFLKQAGLWTLGLTLSGLASLGLESTRLAAWASEKTKEVKGLNLKGPNGVGYAAWKLGVRAYDVSRSEQETVVSFSHVDPLKQGTLSIQELEDIKKFTLRLNREPEALTVVWNEDKGEFSLLDAKGRRAHFVFNVAQKAWVADDDFSRLVLAENEDVVKLMGAVAADFLDKNLKQNTNKTSPSVGAAAIYCDYSHPISADRYGTSRSVACYWARQDAAYRCSNQYCIGCCDYLSCDCYCALGDYFCYCSIIGFPCTT